MQLSAFSFMTCDDCYKVIPMPDSRSAYSDEASYLCRECAIRRASKMVPDRPVEPEVEV